jgi:hypothetical protein
MEQANNPITDLKEKERLSNSTINNFCTEDQVEETDEIIINIPAHEVSEL